LHGLQYARRYQNSSVRESQEPSFLCQCHDIIMSLSDGVLCFTRRRLLSYVQLCCHPATRTRNSSQRRIRQNVTMSLVISEWKRQWQRHSAYVLQCQTPKTPLASDDVGDGDQRIKHSDDDRPGLTQPTYYRTVLCIL